jgi:hypothetical protein
MTAYHVEAPEDVFGRGIGAVGRLMADGTLSTEHGAVLIYGMVAPYAVSIVHTKLGEHIWGNLVDTVLEQVIRSYDW